MTASEIAHKLHGKKAGKRWMCRCPVSRNHQHGDRDPSLRIWDDVDEGWVRFKCWVGCTRYEILAAMGLKIRDLALNELHHDPEWERRKSDRELLETLERRHGLFIMLQAVETGKRNYWRGAERNTAVEIKALRRIMFPVEAYYERRNEITQHLISEYGFEELWTCLPTPFSS